MPHDLNVTFDTEPQEFPPATPIAADWLVSTDAPSVAPVKIPYGDEHKCTLEQMPEGHWTVSVQLQEPDDTLLGAALTGTIDVPPDGVILDVPLTLHLALVN